MYYVLVVPLYNKPSKSASEDSNKYFSKIPETPKSKI